jgi:tight adherence protein B
MEASLLAMTLAMSTQDLLLLILPILGSMLMVFGIYQVITEGRVAEKSKIMDRLLERAAGGGRGGKAKQSAESLLRKRQADAELMGITRLLSNARFIPRVQRLLDQANVDWNASKMVLNIACLALLLLFGAIAVTIPAYVGMLCAVLTGAGPFMWLSVRRRRRMNRLLEQLPDVFELLGQALRAGHSLASGVQLVSDQLPDPAGTEFARVFHEQNMGIKIEEALVNMADRVDQMDVRFFVGAVLIQRQTGGDLAEILDKISGVIRSRIELFGMVRALTAEGRLSGTVLLALAPVVFVALLIVNPDYGTSLLIEPAGKLMLFIAVGMQIMGAAMIRKITTIRV